MLCRLNKIITRLNKIIIRSNDLLCRLNKLFIMFKQDNNPLLSVSQLTETSQNVPKRTRTYRNGPKRTYKTTETDFSGYRNGLYSVPKRCRMWFQLTQKRIQRVPEKIGQVMVENKCMCVV